MKMDTAPSGASTQSDGMYAKEERIAAQTRQIIESSSDFPPDAHNALVDILTAYETLLHETKLLIRHADKFNLRQKRLNEKLIQQHEELKSTQARLRQSEKMASLTLMVAGIAHEVNTPIGICITASSLLLDSTRQFDKKYQAAQVKKSDLEGYLARNKELSELLASNLHRAAELVTSFKQVAVDQTSQKRRIFNLKTTLQETLNSLGHLFKNTPRTIHLDCPDSITLDSFPGAISQVAINLMMNAHIHAFDETGPGAITISAAMEEDTVTLKFADNGKGINQDNLKQVFEPFFTTRRGQGGSGLGLHIVYNLVTATLCGSIDVESTLGQGTCFIVKLPLLACHETDGNPSP